MKFIAFAVLALAGFARLPQERETEITL